MKTVKEYKDTKENRIIAEKDLSKTKDEYPLQHIVVIRYSIRLVRLTRKEAAKAEKEFEGGKRSSDKDAKLF